jgi:YD repeat-containing protein
MSHTLLYAIDDVTEKKKMERNEKGLLISETKYYGDDSGEKTTYEYDEKENVTAIIKYDEESEFISREEIKYDEKGSLAERRTTDVNGNQISKIVFSPVVDNKIEEQEFDEKNNLVSKTIIKFDDNSKEKSTVQTNPQGKLITRIDVTYDDNGNVIRRDYKDFYSKSVHYTYNEKNQVVSQELLDENGMLMRKNLFEYDDDGNVIAEQTYEMDTSRGGRDKHYGTRYEYEYY